MLDSHHGVYNGLAAANFLYSLLIIRIIMPFLLRNYRARRAMIRTAAGWPEEGRAVPLINRLKPRFTGPHRLLRAAQLAVNKQIEDTRHLSTCWRYCSDYTGW
jgi:hypothetical protein